MKLFILVALLCLTAVLAVPASKYTDKFDHINVDEILESDKLLQGYVNCLLDKSRCTPDGKTLKETLPDALEHECSKCTEKQKTSSDKVIRHLVNKRPDLWDQLAAKYDPERIYQERYKDKLDDARSKA